ncbi:hypothetical protein GWK47_037453 [Chionoecetes opilio]|uniref:Uncharacterized protein n=1 Tax=Chionoecetes opilio TaxID=41210 RepID=A0A8J5CYP6_CHIOP|nr:hypothetical protein GWK47_037453 [Chionoecetes opilio]
MPHDVSRGPTPSQRLDASPQHARPPPRVSAPSKALEPSPDTRRGIAPRFPHRALPRQVFPSRYDERHPGTFTVISALISLPFSPRSSGGAARCASGGRRAVDSGEKITAGRSEILVRSQAARQPAS